MISIIIPIYNSEKYINECIDSLINQTYKNIEIILIDDGSTDSSYAICEAYQKKDNRIKLFKKDNGGQGSARNLGLQIATGDYIMFVDSDDALELNTILENYNILKPNPNIDFLQFPIYRNYYAKDAFLDKGKESIYSKDNDFKKLMLDESIITWIVCDKIFKKELLKDHLFPEDMIYEDNYFMIDLCDKLNCIYISEKGIYYYYKRQNSTTTSKVSFNSELSTCKVLLLTLGKINSVTENKLFLKYLVRLINVNKSLIVNFKHSLLGINAFKHEFKTRDIINSNLDFKNKLKLFIYKFYR